MILSISVFAAAATPLVITYLQERRSRIERQGDQAVESFREWLRRNEHRQILGFLESHANVLGRIEQIVEEFSDLGKDISRLQIALLERLDILSGSGWLSKHPLSNRPHREIPLVGRQRELDWLASQERQDCVISGQPGSGKSYLLEHFVASRHAFFARAHGMGLLENELVAVRPDYVIVDDAGDKHDLLAQLIHFRHTHPDQPFAIIAVCWPSEREHVAQRLGLSLASTHELQPLTRNEIVEVVKAVGIHGPNALIHLIVDQSRNKPGLAVTLSEIARHSGIEELWNGSALATAMKGWFTKRLEDDVVAVLAAFAFGDEGGIPITIVARELEISKHKLVTQLKELEAGGVITDLGERRVAVQPAALRHALLKDRYFSDGVHVDPTSMLSEDIDKKYLASSLIGVRRVGGNVSIDTILDLLNRIGTPSTEFKISNDPWLMFAWLGENEARRTFDLHPHYALTNAEPFLHYLPDRAIPFLLDKSTNDQRRSNRSSASPVEILRRWVEAALPQSEDCVERRKTLAMESVKWAIGHTQNDAGIEAIAAAFSPSFKNHETDPGIGRTVMLRRGCLGIDQLNRIGQYWSEVALTLRGQKITNWKSMMRMIADWAYPGRHIHHAGESDDEKKAIEATYSTMYDICRIMIRDLMAMSNGHAGVCHELSALRSEALDGVTVPTDPDFETLYFEPSLHGDYQQQCDAHVNQVHILADTWSNDHPAVVAERISKYEVIASQSEIRGTAWMYSLAKRLAANSEALGCWIDAFLDTSCSAEPICAFLFEASRRNCADFEQWVETVLSNDKARFAAISVALHHASLSSALLKKIEAAAAESAGRFDYTYLFRDAPAPSTRQFLRSNHQTLAAAAAKGLWYADRKGGVPADLIADWKRAVISALNEDHTVGEIFKKYPDVRVEWLRARMRDPATSWYSFSHALADASRHLSREERISLLQEIPEKSYCDECIQALVKNDPGVYEEFVNCRRDRSPNLAPLRRSELKGLQCTVDVWRDLATVALSHGASATEVAYAALHPPMAWSQGTKIWEGRIKWYEQLTHDGDTAIAEVGREGMRLAQRELEQVRREIRHEELHGI